MRNRLSVILVFVVIVLSLCACESKQIKDARIAFEEKRYEDVIRLLEDEQIEDPELLRILSICKGIESYNNCDYESAVAYLKEIDLSNDREIGELLIISEVYVSFRNEEYDNTIELLAELKTPLDDELETIRVYSEAHLAYEDEDYKLVIDYLGNKLEYADDKIVLDSWEKLLEASFGETDVDSIIGYSEKETFPNNIALQSLSQKCDDFDYDSFILMESLVEELPDGELKASYVTYLNDNKKTKTKAFLKGIWEWQTEHEIKTVVEIHVSEDDSQCVGYVKQVGTDLEWYRFNVGEVYWKDLIFEDGILVSSSNLTKTTTGVASYSLARYSLFFETGTMQLRVISGRRYVTVQNGTRTWTKISDTYD